MEGDTFTQTIAITRKRLEEVKPSKAADTMNFYVGSNSVIRSVNRESRRKDHISHFLLRLYCCRTEELKKWFIWHETKFLQFQLLDERNLSKISEFLACNNLNYQEVDDTDKCSDLLRDEKLMWNQTSKQASTNVKIFKIPFEEALEMVRIRRVYLERGNAYLLPSDMVSIICMRFRMELSNMLASLSRRLPILDEDDRLIPRVGSVYYDLVTKVDQMKKADEKMANKERITPEMIDDLAKESFPPCMRSIHEQLRKNHHLKHYGRLHYGLFLKSVGLTLHDALQFFREEFIQTVAPEKFAKEYSYNIRYNYGQEGKKTSLSAYGCKKIINDNPPGPGDSHGCPFRHFDRDNLTALLRRCGADDSSLSEMMEFVEKKEYTGACTRYFKCKHPSYVLRAEGQEIYHPNQFYSESRRAHRGIVNYPTEDGAGDENSNEAKEGSGRNFNDVDDFLDDALDAELKEVTDAQLMDTAAENEENGSGQVSEAVVETDPVTEFEAVTESQAVAETDAMDVEEKVDVEEK